MKFELLSKEIGKTSALIEPLMLKYASNYFNKKEGLYDKITYTFSEIGLRIRPFLIRMGYEAGGGNFNEILPIAVAVEFMQLATLVIDDVLDDSQMRNGRDSVNKQWGIKNAILIGELLKSLSAIILVRSIQESKRFKRVYDIIKVFENTYKDICIGQCLDLNYEEEKIISESEYFKMIKKTTALFIQSSIKIGSMLSGASEDIVNILGSYGLSLGYAYQIRDDVIDIIGEEKFTGKPFGGDIRRRKKKLPIIHAFSKASSSIRERLEVFYEKDIIDDKDDKEIIGILHDCGSIEYSINKTSQFCKKAVNEIEGIKNYKVKKLLFELAELIASFEN